MANRYLLIRRWRIPPLITIIITGAVIASVNFPHPSSAFPAQRRTMSLVDRLIRSNPLRALTNLVKRKLSMELYYPQPPFLQGNSFSTNPMHMSGNNPGPWMTPTHYVKMPPSWQPVYYIPPAIPMTTSALAMLAPVTRQPAQLQQQSAHQPYLLHGVSYPVGNPVQQQQQHHFVHPPVSTYQQPVPQAPSPSYQTHTLGQSTGVEHSYSSFTASSAESSPPPPSVYASPSLSQVESPPQLIHSEYVDGGYPYPPDVISNFVNENHSGQDSSHAKEQLQVPPQYDSHSIIGETDNNGEDAHPAPSIKIVVIRPSDLKNMKKMEEELARGGDTSASSQDMANDFTMKYIDMDDVGTPSDPQFILDSSNVHDAPVNSESDPDGGGSSCAEPMCDPFLRKLIPELLASSTSFQHHHHHQRQDEKGNDEEPIVIVKSDNDTAVPFDYSVSYIPNHNYRPATSVSEDEDDQMTLIQSIEESNIDPLRAQHSNLKPKRVHFPRKFLSAKINSTSYESKSRRTPSTLMLSGQGALKRHRKLHKLAHSNNRLKSVISTSARSSLVDPPPPSTEEEAVVIPKPRVFELERSYPYYRYGSKAARHLNRLSRDNKLTKTTHYTAGVLFNGKSNAVAPTLPSN